MVRNGNEMACEGCNVSRQVRRCLDRLRRIPWGALRRPGRTRLTVKISDEDWQKIQDGARKRGIPADEYLVELAMHAADD